MARRVSRRTKARWRQHYRQRRDRYRAAGLTSRNCYFHTRLWEQIAQRAAALGVHRQMVLRAAIDLGVRHLTTSDILRVAQEYRGILGVPIAARYPGEVYERKPEYLERANAALRRKRSQPCPDDGQPSDAPIRVGS